MSYTSHQSEPPKSMTVEEFLAWSENQEGRYELVDGVVYAQASARAAHVKMKLVVTVSLMNAIKKRGVDCHALVDGMAVRIGTYHPSNFPTSP